ncbi:MAG TPA: transglycosylase domain-containing protein [Beijerinckiaceae bacterium]
MGARGWRHGIAAAALLGLAGVYGAAVAERAVLVAPTPTPILYDRSGAFLTQVGHEVGEGEAPRVDYGYWTVDPLPDRVVRATLALEDRRFWSHPGVDPLAVGRALWQNFSSGRRRSGASTVAMQVARMQRPGPRTLWTKTVEAGTAIALTARYGRKALLGHYLRLVPYGNGSHGIAHAARWYLDKPVQDLSWAEVALLAAIPQSPTAMNPRNSAGLQRAVRRGARVLDELLRQGVIGEAEHALARGQLAASRPPPVPRRPDALHAILRLSAMAGNGGFRLSPADPRLRTTIDLAVQADVTRLTRRHVAEWRPSGAEQAAVMVVRRATREVLAAAGSADYRDRRSGAFDFTRVPRSPGSTLKPFIYALALEKGLLKTSDILIDLPEGSSGIGNADGHFLGPMLPRQALANSRNVPAVNLLRALGLDTAFRFFRDLGLHEIEVPAESFGLSMAIGSLPTTLERLMRAYGALADDGLLADLVWHEGERTSAPRRVLSPESARLVTHFLADPLARLPSFPRYGPTEFPFPVALKTGTSQGYRDAWLVAWSQNHLVGVWVGRGDAGTMTRLTGARSAARLARAILMRLEGNAPGDLAESSFPAPEGRVPAELCVLDGRRSAGGCGQTLTEWVPADDLPPFESAVAVAPAHRAWAKANAYPVEPSRPSPPGEVRLRIVAPDHNSRIWRNPETPAGLERLVLKAVVEPPVPQVVWYVDGEPFSVADPDKPVFWPVTPGSHRFELRLPHRTETSRPVRIVVE